MPRTGIEIARIGRDRKRRFGQTKEIVVHARVTDDARRS
jgi:hypothetical protein